MSYTIKLLYLSSLSSGNATDTSADELEGAYAVGRTVVPVRSVMIEIIPTREYCFETANVFAVKEEEKYANNIHSLRLRWWDAIIEVLFPG
jgi:hypothetical protein